MRLELKLREKIRRLREQDRLELARALGEKHLRYNNIKKAAVDIKIDTYDDEFVFCYGLDAGFTFNINDYLTIDDVKKDLIKYFDINTTEAVSYTL